MDGCFSSKYLTELQLLRMLRLEPLSVCLCSGVSLLRQLQCMLLPVDLQLLSVQGSITLQLQLLPKRVLQQTEDGCENA